MAHARLIALASIVTAGVLASLSPHAEGVAVAILIGWAGVAALGIGLWFGAQAGLTAAALAFVVRIAVVSAVIGPPVPPVWIQITLAVLAIELAVISIEARDRPRPLVRALSRAALSTGIAFIAAVSLESAVYGASGGGLLLRVAAIVALVVLVGWVVTMWSRAAQ